MIIHMLPTSTHGSILLFIYYFNAVIDHGVEGDREFLRFLVHLVHTLRVHLLKPMKSS